MALIRDWGDVTRNPGRGLYGAVVVGPRGATYGGEGTSVEVRPPKGAPYRDVTLFFQDEDEAIGTHRMPYATQVRGVVGINYGAAPMSARLARSPDPSKVYDAGLHGDPATPVIEAYAGDPMRIHVLAPWSEQSQVFSIEGHRWPEEPGRPGTPLVSSTALGGLNALTIVLDGAGGPERLPGDYVYGDHRLPYKEAGLWGVLRVLDPRSVGAGGLEPLPEPSSSGAAARIALGSAALVLAGGLTVADWAEITVVRGADGRRRCGWCTSAPEYVAYHDDEWGRPVVDDVRIYEKICLEGFQSGLSWLTILRKREGFRRAFAGFDPEAVARFGPADVERLVAEPAIVRHRGKIEAAIANAHATLNARERHGSLAAVVWAFEPPRRGRPVPARLGDLDATTPESVALSKALRKLGFRFVGPTTAYAAMESLGLVNDHLAGCHVRTACNRDRRALQVPVSPPG